MLKGPFLWGKTVYHPGWGFQEWLSLVSLVIPSCTTLSEMPVSKARDALRVLLALSSVLGRGKEKRAENTNEDNKF